MLLCIRKDTEDTAFHESVSQIHFKSIFPNPVLTKHVADYPCDEHEAIDDGDGDEELVGLQLRAEETGEVNVNVEVDVGSEVIGVRVDVFGEVIDVRVAKAEGNQLQLISSRDAALGSKQISELVTVLSGYSETL